MFNEHLRSNSRPHDLTDEELSTRYISELVKLKTQLTERISTSLSRARINSDILNRPIKSDAPYLLTSSEVINTPIHCRRERHLLHLPTYIDPQAHDDHSGNIESSSSRVNPLHNEQATCREQRCVPRNQPVDRTTDERTHHDPEHANQAEQTNNKSAEIISPKLVLFRREQYARRVVVWRPAEEERERDPKVREASAGR